MPCIWCGSGSHNVTRCPYESKEAARRANPKRPGSHAKLYCSYCHRRGHTLKSCIRKAANSGRDWGWLKPDGYEPMRKIE